jgi:hypothetical protein
MQMGVVRNAERFPTFYAAAGHETGEERLARQPIRSAVRCAV